MKRSVSFALVSALVTGFATSAAQADILFNDKFDDRSFSGWVPSGNNTAKIVNSPVRGGNYAAELKLDRLEDKVPTRTELSLSKTKLEIGKEYWIGLSEYLHESWRFGAREGAFVMQIHKRPDAGDASGKQPLTVGTKLGVWRLSIHFDARSKSTKSSVGVKNFSLGTVNKGQWIDWVFHIKFSYQTNGLLEVWQNGKKVLTYNGPNCFNDKLGPYLKVGIYNPLWSNRSQGSPEDKLQLYVDEVKVGDQSAGYGNVAP